MPIVERHAEMAEGTPMDLQSGVVGDELTFDLKFEAVPLREEIEPALSLKVDRHDFTPAGRQGSQESIRKAAGTRGVAQS